VAIGGCVEFDCLARRVVLPMVYNALTPRAGHSARSGETNNMSGILMSFKKRVPASLALLLAICMARRYETQTTLFLGTLAFSAVSALAQVTVTVFPALAPNNGFSASFPNGPRTPSLRCKQG